MGDAMKIITCDDGLYSIRSDDGTRVLVLDECGPRWREPIGTRFGEWCDKELAEMIVRNARVNEPALPKSEPSVQTSPGKE